MHLPPNFQLPTPTALALLEATGDPVAVFDRGAVELVWHNAAWQSLVDCLQRVAPSGQSPQVEMAKHLATLWGNADQRSSSVRFRTPEGPLPEVEIAVSLHTFQDRDRQMVAVVAPGSGGGLSTHSGGLLSDHESIHQRDPLTGLPGRRALEARLRRYTRRTESDPDFALLFLDLDGFKLVNDRHGHAAGDHVLAKVAERLASEIRDEDLIARYGGDEFVVLVTHLHDRGDLAPIIARLSAAAATPVAYEGREFRLTASIGAALSSEGWTSIAELIHAADRRMYAEKQLAAGDAGR